MSHRSVIFFCGEQIGLVEQCLLATLLQVGQVGHQVTKGCSFDEIKMI